MEDDKFHIVSEVRIGTLDENLLSEWERLHAAHVKLVALQEEHEEAMSAFWDAVERKFYDHGQIHGPGHGKSAEFRVSPEGEVYIEHCSCPVCQAELHGMTVSETVEEMYKNDLIPHQVIDHIRQRAKAVDSRQKMSKKMLN